MPNSPFANYEPDNHGVDAEIDVRPLQAEDVERCAELAVHRNGLDIGTWRGSFEGSLNREDRQTFVALRRGRVIGYASITWMNPVADGGANAPEGWYLTGVVVDPLVRRRGVGKRLTQARLEWLAGRTDRVWYFATALNHCSLDLHTALGFREVTRDFSIPGVIFSGGEGILSVNDTLRA
jgi:ribosomal protein S18 acetylase RimI-like enzyme